MEHKSNEIKTIEYPGNGKIITFNKPLVMAILNITPDSFYDGGKYSATKDILRDAEEKISQGADIIDLGAASSRPGAKEISEEEEWERLSEPLTVLRKKFPNTVISVDTYRASVAEKSAGLGADMINDIGGGTLDKNMFETVARINLPYVLMHIQGNPQTMQLQPKYDNVSAEIMNAFTEKTDELRHLGFNKVILDPGFGFGKSLTHNYQILKELKTFAALGYPLLAGISRKGMINKVINTNPVTALNGTTVLNTIALLNGADILRVHDVTEAVQAVELVEYYQHA